MIGWAAGGLNNENVRAADVFIDLHEGLPIGKCRDCGLAQRGADALANRFGQNGIGITGKNFEGGAVHTVVRVPSLLAHLPPKGNN